MDYFLGKILHGLLLGLLLGLLHGLLHMGYYMLGFYMVGVPAADVRRRAGREVWRVWAGGHAAPLWRENPPPRTKPPHPAAPPTPQSYPCGSMLSTICGCWRLDSYLDSVALHDREG